MEAPDRDLGRVIAISGSSASARLFKDTRTAEPGDAKLTIGRLVGIRVDTSLIIGVVVSMSVSQPEPGDDEGGHLVAAIDFMGEIKGYRTPSSSFQRGVSNYPSIGNPVTHLHTEDIAVIHRIENGDTIEVGRLRLDPTVPA